MDCLRSPSCVFKSLMFLLMFFAVPSFSADPDPLQDFCVADLNASLLINGFPCKLKVSSEDFFFSGLFNPLNTSNPDGAAFRFGTVDTFPALNTLGLSVNYIELAPGGIVAPHVHPRASEAVVLLEGSLFAGFVTTNNTFYSDVMSAGEMFVIPRGLVHFELNIGTGRARMLAILNSQNPGFSFVSTNLFGSNPTIPNEVLTRAFRTDDRTVNMIKSMFFT